MRHMCNKGFTLIEMTIVMVILSVFSAGVLVGHELMVAAELRATAKQVDMMNSAYNAFRLKYNCLPGDCANATQLGFVANFTIDFAFDHSQEQNQNPFSPVSSAHAFSMVGWGAGAGASLQMPGTVSPVLIPDYTPTQINGNDDGKLEIATYEPPISLALLDQAQLLDQSYSDKVRVDIKLSRANGMTNTGSYNKAFWMPFYLVPGTNSLIDAPGHYYFALATLFPTIGAGTFLPTDASFLDTKIDNGLPSTGIMRASSDRFINPTNGPQYLPGRDDTAGFCLAQDANLKPIYNVTNMLARCAVVVKMIAM